MLISTLTSASSLDVLLDTVLIAFDGVNAFPFRTTSPLDDFRGVFFVTSVILAMEFDRWFSFSTDFFGDGADCFEFVAIPNALLLILFLSSNP